MARERRLASMQPKAWRGAHLACSATGSTARSRRTAPALGFFACFGCRAAAGGCCALAALSAAGGAAFCLRGGGTSLSTAAAGRAGGGSAAAASRSRLRFFSFFALRSAAPPKLGPSSTSPVVTSVTTTRGIAPSMQPGEDCWLVKPVRRARGMQVVPPARAPVRLFVTRAPTDEHAFEGVTQWAQCCGYPELRCYPAPALRSCCSLPWARCSTAWRCRRSSACVCKPILRSCSPGCVSRARSGRRSRCGHAGEEKHRVAV